MENAIKIAGGIIAACPATNLLKARKTDRLHSPDRISGSMEGAKLGFIIRDFEEAGLKEKEDLLKRSLRTLSAAIRVRPSPSRCASSIAT